MYQRIRLGFFPEGRRKAFTLSFDDGLLNDRPVIDILNRYGLKGTFHLNAGRLGWTSPRVIEPGEVAELYRGHEVSSHTYTHPFVSRVPRENLIFEVMEDRRILESLSGQMVRGMSYPNGGVPSPEVADLLRHCGMRYARTCGAKGSTATPEDFMYWTPTSSAGDPDAQARLEKLIKSKLNSYLDIYYWWCHSSEIGGAKCSWESFEQLCATAAAHKDELWCATNLEICDYVTAGRNLQFSVDQTMVYNPSCIDVWVEVGIDNCLKIPAGETVRIPDYPDAQIPWTDRV